MYQVALAMQRSRAVERHEARDPSGETAPRNYVFDEMFAPVWDPSGLEGNASRKPAWLQLAQEVNRERDQYDAIVTWGEKVTLALAALQRFDSSRKPHIAMMYQFTKPNTQLPMRVLGSSMAAIVTWTTVQRDYAIKHLGIPSSRIFLVRHYVDQLFFSPREGALDQICAVGAEMRDYPTLIEAMRGTGVRCDIASDHVRVPGAVRLVADRRIPVDQFAVPSDAQVTFGRRTPTQLRDLYARSRFVVVPLVPSDSDNGVTVILEAMAMGRAVICSRTKGQVDVLQDGVTGIYVDQGDPKAMREAIMSLWHDPDRARAMGERARAYVEENHTLEQFATGVRAAAEATLAGIPASDTWWVQSPGSSGTHAG